MQGADATAATAALWPRAQPQLLERVETIEDAVAALLTGGLDDDVRDTARREAHRLSGTLGMFGVTGGSVIARELESAFKEPPDTAAAPLLAARALELRRAVEGHEGAQRQEPPELVLVGFSGVRAGALLRAAADRGLRAATGGEAISGVVLLDGGLPELEHRVAELAAAGSAVAVSVPRDADRVGLVRHGARRVLPSSLPPDAVIEELVQLRRDPAQPLSATILAVDDEPLTRRIVSRALEGAGRRVATCSHPGELWEALERTRPDLIVLDVQMPGIDGAELCRALRADPRWRGIPVLFLTGTTDPATVAALFAAGGDDYVPKPVEPAELRARVAGRLARMRHAEAAGTADAVTGLTRRGSAEPQLAGHVALARRLAQPLCVAVVAVAGLSTGGDEQEHALAAAGRAIRETLPPGDVAATWSAGELVVALLGADEHDARRVLAAVTAAAPGLTVSAGIAEYPRDGDGLAKLVAAARAAGPAAGGVALSAEPEGGVERVDVALVEDDAVLAELVLDGLRARGYSVRWIVDGDAAAEQLGGDRPPLRADLVLLDWDLPARDGPTVLRGLAADGALASTRVVMLTARASQREILTTLELGATEHVAKPFSLAVLLQRVERALGR